MRRWMPLFSSWVGRTHRDTSPNPNRLKGSDRNKYVPHLKPSARRLADQHNAALRLARLKDQR